MELEKIQKKAAQTFEKNLDYLQKNQKRVYQKILEFESAVANGYYHERYELEYKDGYFDVKELDSNNYLYGSDSNSFAKMIAKSIDYKKEDNIFIISPRYEFAFPDPSPVGSIVYPISNVVSIVGLGENIHCIPRSDDE